MGGEALDVDCHKGAVFTGISTFIRVIDPHFKMVFFGFLSINSMN